MSAVTFTDLVELAKERDAFLAESVLHSAVHSIGGGRHQVRLWFCFEGIQAESVCGAGDHYWQALTEAMRLLREHPVRKGGA